MRPWALYLIRHYSDRLTMMKKSDGYFGTPFKGYRGVTQGGLLYPTIFNVVIDAVVQSCVTVVELMEEAVYPGTADMERFMRDVQPLSEYFYLEILIIALT